MTTERLRSMADSYARAFPKYPPLAVHGRWIYGVWEIGADYKGSGYYGAYPPSYLKRIRALFPEAVPASTLHLFAGSVQRENPVRGLRVDVNASLGPDVCALATALPVADRSVLLTLADPPYSPADAVRYGTPMVVRKDVMREVARVTAPGGHLVWLDTVKPMYRKAQWTAYGSIGLARSTNHRVRFVFLFERTGGD